MDQKESHLVQKTDSDQKSRLVPTDLAQETRLVQTAQTAQVVLHS